MRRGGHNALSTCLFLFHTMHLSSTTACQKLCLLLPAVSAFCFLLCILTTTLTVLKTLTTSGRKTVVFHLLSVTVLCRALSRVLRRVCCWWAAAEHQLLDNVCIERSIDSPVVVDQGDELGSHQC